jgi:hypothetical protein
VRLLLRARVVCLRFVSCRSPLQGTRVPALTLGVPTRVGVGALACVRLGAYLAEACCGRVCSWVAGLRFFVFVWVFAFSGCWRFGGVVGRGCPSPPPLAPACLLACVLAPLVWALLACAMLRLCVGVVTVMGRDNYVPPHTLLVALLGCCVRAEGEKG